MRVIAGTARGVPLRAPRDRATRPVTDRVKETLFGILGERVPDARVLDLYAGSGALGIEALSRGAQSVVFVEHDRAAVACIRENLAAIGASERARVLPVRVSAAFSALGDEPFELVFCDPPWDDLEAAVGALEKLAASRHVAGAARLVLEHSARDSNPDVSGLVAVDRRRWGDTAVSFFELAARS
jgi:16S rRNA (guanine(966)-N(2))-methyltransferase RsmD